MRWPWHWPWAAMCANGWRRFGLIARACLRREGIALVALLASVAGAGVLSAMLAWAIHILDGARKWDAITNIAYGLLGAVVIILWSFGRLMAGKQAIEAEFWHLKFKASQSGGDEADDEPAIPPAP